MKTEVLNLGGVEVDIWRENGDVPMARVASYQGLTPLEFKHYLVGWLTPDELRQLADEMDERYGERQ